LVLHARSDSDAREETFVVAEEAARSHHAVGRSLVWLAYKAGVLSREAGEVRECPFPRHDHVENDAKYHNTVCRTLLAQDYGKEAPLSDDAIDPDSVYASWLRYLWVEIFYWARFIRENRRESSEGLLSQLAEKYGRAIKATREAFPRMLAARQTTDDGLRVDWRWLYLWFLANAMNSRALEKEYGSYAQDRHGFRSHLDHYRDASTAVLFGLHLVRFWDGAITLELWDLPELRPDEVMQARLRLLCEYAYLEIGVDRTWQLEHHLGAQFQPEMVLQATSSAHRQHALHVMDVCLLGHLLVGSHGADGTASRLQQAILVRRPAEQFLRMWYPAALLHDVGRAQEVAHSIPDLLNNLGTPDLRKYAAAVQKGIEEASGAFDKAIIKQFKGRGLDLAPPTGGISRDHGVVSANHVIHSLMRTAGDEGFLKKDDTKAILRAIAKHARRCESFGASVEPLSYLLVLSDHLQEWSRPRFAAQQLAMSFLGATQISTPFTVKGQRAAYWLAPEAKYDAGPNGIGFLGNSIRLNLQCAPPKSSLFEPACLWVSMTAELERIWFDDGYPGVKLVFVHPRSEVLVLSHYGVVEMELLRDFAATAQGAFLSTWLRSVASNADGMSYRIDDAKKVERFSLHVGVRREGAPRLLAAMPNDFYSQFVRWKERHLHFAGED
jgi:hypothetical protein